MREIKFRAWDKKNKEFIYIENWYWFEEQGIQLLDDEYGRDFIFTQYTGLHDKNDKEIYEGDIVKFNFQGYAKKRIEEHYEIKIDEILNDKSKIYWCGGGWWSIELWIGGVVPFQHNFGNYHSDDTNIEIIGDIYQNPELLK